MNLNPAPNFDSGPVLSEGKILELIPIIQTADGRPFHLPACRWEVPNWLLGYRDDHVETMLTYHLNQTIQICGSSAAYGARLTMLVRIVERQPGSDPYAGATIDLDAAQAILDALTPKRELVS